MSVDLTAYARASPSHSPCSRSLTLTLSPTLPSPSGELRAKWSRLIDSASAAARVDDESGAASAAERASAATEIRKAERRLAKLSAEVQTCDRVLENAVASRRRIESRLSRELYFQELLKRRTTPSAIAASVRPGATAAEKTSAAAEAEARAERMNDLRVRAMAEARSLELELDAALLKRETERAASVRTQMRGTVQRMMKRRGSSAIGHHVGGRPEHRRHESSEPASHDGIGHSLEHGGSAEHAYHKRAGLSSSRDLTYRATSTGVEDVLAAEHLEDEDACDLADEVTMDLAAEIGFDLGAEIGSDLGAEQPEKTQPCAGVSSEDGIGMLAGVEEELSSKLAQPARSLRSRLQMARMLEEVRRLNSPRV